jgi:hypothetical protein
MPTLESFMVHPLVEQLRFARGELVRALDGVSDDDARRRLVPMNCLSWFVGHLAHQEQQFFLVRQGVAPVAPELNDLCGFGKPASTPPLDEMWAAWTAVTTATDPILDAFTGDDLLVFPAGGGLRRGDSNGTMLLRTTSHYWYHIGESQAVRQLLGHRDLSNFIGDLGARAPYRPA